MIGTASGGKQAKRLLRVKEAAEMLGVSARQIYLMVWDGTLSHVLVGKRLIRVELAKMERYIAANTARCGS
jgi:excisionase family DNA binding protein